MYEVDPAGESSHEEKALKTEASCQKKPQGPNYKKQTMSDCKRTQEEDIRTTAGLSSRQPKEL